MRGRHAFGPGPRRRGFRRQCRLSDEQQCRARVRHLRRLGRRRSLTQGPKCRPQLGGEEPRLLPGGEVVALVDLVRARGAPASSRYLLAGLDRSPPSAACLVGSGPRPPWATGVSPAARTMAGQGLAAGHEFRCGDARHDGGPTPGVTVLVGRLGFEPGLPSSRRWHPIAG
jgi:hypothetical protein